MDEEYEHDYDEMYIRMGENVATYRKLKNISQIELAEQLDISRTHMSNIEAPNMPTPISLKLMFKICDTLGITPGDLFKKN